MPARLKYSLLILLLLTINVNISCAQGCSDAGICSIEKIKPGMEMDGVSNQFRFGIGYGNADHAIRVITPYLAYSRQFNKFSIETRLTTISQKGNETSAFGLSDLYFVGNYAVLENFQFSAGLKVPLSDANRLLDGQPLPMDYQSSLGTLDLLLGVLYRVKKFELALAYQQPLTQNSNSFLSEEYPVDSDFNKFQSTNNYIRNGDVLLRASYPISIGQKFAITPSLLPIYHLGDDRYTNILSVEEPIIGSEGLTLNINFYFDLAVGKNDNMQFSLGAPLIVRDARPDGLTRHYVVNLEYQVNF